MQNEIKKNAAAGTTEGLSASHRSPAWCITPGIPTAFVRTVDLFRQFQTSFVDFDTESISTFQVQINLSWNPLKWTGHNWYVNHWITLVRPIAEFGLHSKWIQNAAGVYIYFSISTSENKLFFILSMHVLNVFKVPRFNKN